MNATDICSICAEPSTDGRKDVIVCYGFCGKSFHLPCLSGENSNYKTSLIVYLKKIKNLNWYCDTCTTLSVNGISSSIIEGAKLFADIKLTLQPQLDKIISTNAAVSVKSSIGTQCCSELSSSVGDQGTNTNNRLDNEADKVMDVDETIVIPDDDGKVGYLGSGGSDMHSPPKPPKPKDLSSKLKRKIEAADSFSSVKQQRLNGQQNVTTGISDTAVNGATASQNISESAASNVFPVARNPFAKTRSLYVSGFNPHTTEEDIVVDLIEQGLNKVDIIRCEKLVSPFKRFNDLTFVSFKITVPENRYVSFADRNVWPEDIDVREFENKVKSPKEVFRKRQPAKKMRNRSHPKAKNLPKQPNKRTTDVNKNPPKPAFTHPQVNSSPMLFYNPYQMAQQSMIPWQMGHQLAFQQPIAQMYPPFPYAQFPPTTKM